MELNRELCASAQKVKHYVQDNTTGMPRLLSCVQHLTPTGIASLPPFKLPFKLQNLQLRLII